MHDHGNGGSNTSRFQSWSRYWSTGLVESCQGSQSAQSNQLLEFWQLVFQAMPESSRVLDVATGNGALPRLAMTTLGNSRRIEIDAIDVAKITPIWLSQRSQSDLVLVRFHDETAAEQLPFADRTMDYVISQFGLEYTDCSRSLPEIGRVLRPKGRMALAVHAKGSLIVRQASAELHELAWFFDAGLFLRASEMCFFAAQAATPEGVARLSGDPAASQARTRFNAMLAELSNRKRQSACAELVHGCAESLLQAVSYARNSGDANAAQVRVEQLAQQYVDMQLRHQELIAHARDLAGMQDLATAMGLQQVQLAPLHDASGNVLAWGCSGQMV